MKHSQFIQVALEAVKAAEEIILHYYHHGIVVDTKTDNSPVTQADKEAEKKIKQIILHHFPNHGFLGEEYGRENSAAEYCWVIDPIDGTKNFIRNIPFFSTLLGLMKGNEVVAGVASWPLLHSTMLAEKGQGAYLNNQLIKVSTTSELEKSYLSYGALPFFEKRGLTKKIVDLSSNTRFYRGWGGELGQYYLPTGQIDIHVDPHVKIWDISPFVIILQEAGGKITDLQGKPITQETNDVIATNGILHDQVVELFNS
jgi:histidinol-phosphatase